MSIDLNIEEIVPVHDAAKLFPTRPSRNTLRRWRTKGVRGVCLETCFIGGIRCTSKEAVARFLQALNAEPQPGLLPKLSAGQRDRQAKAAMEKVQELVGV